MLPHNIIVLLPLIASALAVPVMKGDPCEAKSDINKRCTFDKRGAAERFNERYLLDVEGAEDGNNKRCDITLPGCNGRKKRAEQFHNKRTDYPGTESSDAGLTDYPGTEGLGVGFPDAAGAKG